MKQHSSELPILTRLAERLRTMGHPVRLLIIGLLKDKELNVSEIADRLDLPVGTVSHHLKIMDRTGLLASRRNGREIHYSVLAPLVREVCDALCRQMEVDMKATRQECEAFKKLRARLKP